MRLQLALNVKNLDRAVDYYGRLFGVEPHKLRPGYANFVVEDPDTGAQAYRYVRTGPNHFSMAFTYDCIASYDERAGFPGVYLI